MKCKIMKNMGKADRIIRAIAAAAFLALGITISAWFYLPAAVMAITSAVGVCPLYVPLGINTLKRR